MKFEHLINLYIHERRYSDKEYAQLMAEFNILEIRGKQLMTIISEFVAMQNEYNSKMSTALNNLEGDIKKLHEVITNLQNTSTEISVEDKALLEDAAAKTKALLDRVSALDELTPPDTTEVPTEPPAPPIESVPGDETPIL